MPREFFPYLICLLLSFAIISCDKDGNSSIYGCCNNDPLSDQVGSVPFFVPNVFTPNGDGINDLLYFICDSSVLIESLIIYNKSGNTVHHLDSLLVYSDVEIWDGKKNGEVLKGIFTVFLRLQSIDGSTGEYITKVCCAQCEYPSHIQPVDCEKCVFSGDALLWKHGLHHSPITECEYCFQ